MVKTLQKLTLSLFVLATFCHGGQWYTFNSSQQEARFDRLTKQYRCVVCENQSLAESNAPLASDLRQKIYEMVVSGKTDDHIRQFMVARYGTFVEFKPPLTYQTVFLWFGPFVLLIILAMGALWLLPQSE